MNDSLVNKSNGDSFQLNLSSISEEVPEVTEPSHQTEGYEIVTELSSEAKLKMECVQNILSAPNRKIRGERVKEAAAKLGKTVRTIQYLLKDYNEKGISAITVTERSDKGEYRISPQWQDFIIKTYKDGNKQGRKMTPAQVAIRVAAEADRQGLTEFPSRMSVYRVLNPIIEKKQKKQKIRNIGWTGSTLSHKTRAGSTIEVKYSNHVWQCDHTPLDIMLVDRYGKPLSRPRLTKITDSYSRCIMGIYLDFDSPSSQVVSLALRHAILPKKYSPEFKLNCEWGTYGVPEHLFTDGGKEFKSDHLKQIAFQLQMEHHLRDRPSEGGIEERGFGIINTDFLAGFSGYLGSNVQQRPPEAEKEACLTLEELHQLIVRYIVDNYNQKIDARSGNQTRFQRWEAGLPALPRLIGERELDVCLKKQTRRTIYRGGYLTFENIRYRGDTLAAYAGDNVILRYDPRDITTVWVYRLDKGKEVFLAPANAMDLERECLSLEEAKAASRKIRAEAKTISNHSILEEVRDRDAFIKDKKKKKSVQQRKKEEQKLVHPSPEPITQREEPAVEQTLSPVKRRVFDYDQLRRDYDG
ncbi:Mu transposase C-terminal domain-containing protein [Limnoraphis robusta Tam1]|uniref:Mu transposase C-terminal domain-containing protein n=1 Tax=Limnoraphis robusta TaxID=1118279 RepID=UPI002B20817C|nr:Mu transposase C-terminal domain-containing protein [Limnoraphis robusta]MEA5499173.1 Mu transposase C-terminal domain-containing protein [Limnoraphis robusta BA-68 BA1]MEA5540706.1 Mu transposase C-terminal domain-containing protein [Limnoraphis robusta Tam1]